MSHSNSAPKVTPPPFPRTVVLAAEEVLVNEIAGGTFRPYTPPPFVPTPTSPTRAETPERRARQQFRREADRIAYRKPWRSFVAGVVAGYVTLAAVASGGVSTAVVLRTDLGKNWPIMKGQILDYLSPPTPPAPGDFFWTDANENAHVSGLIARDGRKWIRPGSQIPLQCWDRWTDKPTKTTLLCRGESPCEVSCGLFVEERE